MEDFKIHCHALSNLMAGEIGLTEKQEETLAAYHARIEEAKTNPKNKLTPNMEAEVKHLTSKKENPELPAGAKTYLKTWLKTYLFEKRPDWKSLVIDKGLMCEQAGIDLVNKVLGIFAFKNEDQFSNSYMQGTPDIVLADIIRDIKNSWDLFTFPMFDDELPKPEYWWQLQGYMILTGKKKAAIDYVLIDTPKPLVMLDLKKLYFQSGGVAEEWSPEKYEEMFPNYCFGYVPDKQRVKTFEFAYEEGIDKKIEQRVQMGRVYLQTLIDKN